MEGISTTIVGTLIHFRRGGNNTFLILRDPEDNSIRVQAVVKDNVKTEFRLGDVLMLEVFASVDERSPEGMYFDVKKSVVVYRPPWVLHAFRLARFLWWNRSNLGAVLASRQ